MYASVCQACCRVAYTTGMTATPAPDHNRLGLDYRAECARLPYRGPIHDVHVHLGDPAAADLFFEVADHYGIERVCTMTPLRHADAIADKHGDRAHFICVPDYADHKNDPDVFTTKWLRRVEEFRGRGSRIIKFWSSPRGRDLHPDALTLDAPIRIEAMKLARRLGYRVFMVHVGDPDTWFARKYTDPRKYGTKRGQYPPFEKLMTEFGDVTWLAAHLGGWPEDLDFLDGLLSRHPNLLLDTSATKWQVRELSKHPRKRLHDFFDKFRGRLLFGSDIVANAADASFDLFASRYWALRTLFETDYTGPSPIVDPDLHMMNAEADAKATAALRGMALPADVLADVYCHNAARLFTSLQSPPPAPAPDGMRSACGR